MLIFRTYSYLYGTLLGTGILVLFAIWALPRNKQQFLFYSGIIGIPSFPLLIYFEDQYWSPLRLGHSALGIEDVLVSFFVAALAWIIASIPLNQKLLIAINFKRFLLRYLFVGASAGLFFLLANKLVFNPMTALILTQIIFILLLILLRPELWPFMVSGIIGFPIVYFLIFNLIILLWPDCVQQWNLKQFWGRIVFGLPVGEIIWSMGHGAFWPLFTCYVFEVRLTPTRRPVLPFYQNAMPADAHFPNNRKLAINYKTGTFDQANIGRESTAGTGRGTWKSYLRSVRTIE